MVGRNEMSVAFERDLARVKELSEAPADGQWPFSEC